jgi:hypothetical protein
MQPFLAAIKLIFEMPGLWALIETTVKGLQAAFPNAGASKLTALLGVIDTAVAQEPTMAGLYAQAKPIIGTVLTPLIALTKTAAATPSATPTA